MLDVVRSVQYLPLNKFQFMRVHNFIQNIESRFPTIENCIFIQNDQLVWSEVNPCDLHSIYEYLLNAFSLNDNGTNLSIHSKYVDSHNGSFLIGLDKDNCLPAPIVYIFNKDQCKKYHFIAYTSQQSVVCCLINGMFFPFLFHSI